MRRLRHQRNRQRTFGFLERADRHERLFKRTILAATALVIVGLVAIPPTSRDVAENLAVKARRAVVRVLGRNATEAELRRTRQLEITQARRTYRQTFPRYRPAVQSLLRCAGLDPDHALLRWGNYDRTLLLSPAVFEADDHGRSYRLRPGVRSVWVRNPYSQERVLEQFLVPDTPAMADAIRRARAVAIPGSLQTSNSWGLRGPEPDPAAPLRGIVLGDSFMQGMFVGDAETPPECLRRFLEERLRTPVSILNTGLLGYSPEQYYASLVEFAERFRPQFVVVTVYANDFGEAHAVFEGEGDWEDGRYWLGRIRRYCRARGLTWLVVPAPVIDQIERLRQGASYPGMVADLSGAAGLEYLDVTDQFVDAHLRAVIAARTQGQVVHSSPLFNGRLEDHHFSKLGSEVWGAAVGQRLVLLLEEKRQGWNEGDVRRTLGELDSSG